MTYQEIYRGLNKRASNEQIKKLASLIGIVKKADTISDPYPKKVRPHGVNYQILKDLSDKVKREAPGKAFKGGVKQFFRHITDPINNQRTARTAVNVMGRGLVDMPGQALRFAGALPVLGAYGFGGPVGGTILAPGAAAIGAIPTALGNAYTNNITNKYLPKNKQRRLLQSKSPALKHINSFLQDATGTTVWGGLAGKALGNRTATEFIDHEPVQLVQPTAFSLMKHPAGNIGATVLQQPARYISRKLGIDTEK